MIPSTSNYALVAEFHRAMRHTHDSIDLTDGSERTKAFLELRKKLIMEEVIEFFDALDSGVLVDVLKEAADIDYVRLGTLVGIKGIGDVTDAVFAEVHASNMSKLGSDGNPLYRDDGKVLKGPNYRAPDLARFIK